jgi:hypothetical protein
LLCEREQHRRIGLAVEERNLLDPAVGLPPEPPRVGPEEVVEVAQLVGVDRRPFAKEAPERVPVAKLDDGHG